MPAEAAEIAEPARSPHVVVLHVEDSEMYRHIFHKMVSALEEDVEVIEAGGVLEAINALGMRPDIDAVILDYMLPTFSSRDVREYAKKLGKKVMYLTGTTKDIVLETDPEATQIIEKTEFSNDFKGTLAKLMNEIRSTPSRTREMRSVSFIDNFMQGIGTKKQEDIT